MDGFGDYEPSFPLKLDEEDGVMKEATREKMGVCGFMSKTMEQGKACLAWRRGQNQARKRGSKNAHFSCVCVCVCVCMRACLPSLACIACS